MTASPDHGSPSELPLRWLVVSASEHPEIAAGRDLGVLLSGGEQRVLDGLRFERRRRKWLLGRLAAKGLLQRVLAASTGCELPLAAIEIWNEPSGAPYAEVAGQGRIAWPISISHRLDWGVAAVAFPPIGAMGIDLETIEPRGEGWYADYFTADEVASLPSSGSERDRAVAMIWSAKEAVLKALGVGLRLDTRTIRVRELCGSETDALSDAAAGLGDPAGVAGRESPWRPLEVTLAPEMGLPGHVRGLWSDGPGYVLTVAVLEASPGGRIAVLESHRR